MLNASTSPPLNPENSMSFVASSWMSPRQAETLLADEASRFAIARFGTASDEDVVIDERSELTPSQAVENRLVALLRESSVPVSHLQIRGFVRGRCDD
jgi:hypothetical protein